MLLRGFFRILLLYDVAEAFDLEKIRALLGPRAEPASHAFPRRTPEYVRFEQAPIVEHTEPLILATGEELVCSLKYYAFAVVVVQFDVPFACDWPELLSLGAYWIDAPDLEPHARAIASLHLDRIAAGVVRPKPSKQWLQESYLIAHVEQAASGSGENATAAEMLSEHGPEIVQLVRGELAPLAPKACAEALEASVSYYPSDLVVVSTSAALVYDRAEDARATFRVLEYAKAQLLEFRYYDTLMTQLLSEVYDSLEEKRGILLQRWRLPREAERFNTIRLDVMELTERIDNAVKFLSDVYYARLYRLVAARIGLPEYRQLVDEKLRTMGELYGFMIDRFNEARSFVLEAGIAVLALLDVVLFAILLLRGG
jgi:hypothetical protein